MGSRCSYRAGGSVEQKEQGTNETELEEKRYKVICFQVWWDNLRPGKEGINTDMGRRPRAATEATAEPAEKAPVVRRRRRRTIVDHAAQTQILVNALLKARSESGATQEDALKVVSWARGVYEGGTELKALATRVRKVRGEGVAERQVAYEVNKALLDGVLSGAMTINVDESGAIVFSDGRDLLP